MLTREQIETYWDWHECNCKFAFDSPTSFEVCNQARQAIDLAAENERLKAKLDMIKEEMTKTRCFTKQQYNMGISYRAGYEDCLQSIRRKIKAIINKDGDDT